MFSNRSRTAIAVAAPLALTAALVGCSDNSGGSDEMSVYCVNNNNEVVDGDHCDDGHGGHGGFFFLMIPGSHNYSTGSRITPPPNAALVPMSDPAARTKAGLPSSGKVKVGTGIKYGGTGKGGVGGAPKGSSGG